MHTDTQTQWQIAGREGGVPETIPLNLIVDYPVRWSRYKVLRDLLQNFYDAVGHPAWPQRFSYTRRDAVLLLEARSVGFSHEWLIPIGASTKRQDPGRYAGYFGEGFKIAALCALRDHEWNIELASQDWELRVVVEDLIIDGQTVPSLAYHLWRRPQARPDTVLALHPFLHWDEETLESALLSFYYPENPLFGAEIWSSPSAAVFHRSARAKPACYPSTFEYVGSGILFAGYQALGSFPFPLIVAQHDFRRNDRERTNFYKMDVLEVLRNVCELVSPACAFQLLEVFQRKWYSYPHRRYDFSSWYPVIKHLIERVADSAEQTQRWRDKHPGLLVAERVKRNELPEYNRRRQALDWVRQERRGYRLVQDGFYKLGYPRLETACEQADGFSRVREPQGVEVDLIRILEDLTATVLDSFFGDDPIPPCKVIDAGRAAWEGMTVTLRMSEPRKNPDGLTVRYRLPWVALKSSAMTKCGFPRAWSTYLHERAHCFGGDQSAAFSLALTRLLQTTLRHGPDIARAEARWVEACERQ